MIITYTSLENETLVPKASQDGTTCPPRTHGQDAFELQDAARLIPNSTDDRPVDASW